MAARQYLLWQAPDVHARVHGVVRSVASAALSFGAQGRSIRVDLRRRVAGSHAVGNSGVGGPYGAARTGGFERNGPLRASGALRPSDDPALGKGRKATPGQGTGHCGLWHAAAAFLLVARLVCSGND